MDDDKSMLLFIWLAVPVVIGGTVLLAAFWLRQRYRVPVAMLAVAAGFYLLACLLTAVILWAVVYVAGIRNGVVLFVVLGPAIGAVCAETLRYLSFRAGRSMRAHRTVGGALMVGLGYGGMSVIIVWVLYLLRHGAYLMRYGALYGFWAHVGLFVLDSVVVYALAVIIQLGLATLVVLAYRRSPLFLPLAVLAGFAVTASLHALLIVHSGSWPLVVCWGAAAMTLDVLVHRSGWLTVAPQDEPAQTSVTG
jgi:hypothetical protein